MNRALPLLARWSWLIVLCGVFVALVARSIAEHNKAGFTAKTRIHVVDTSTEYNSFGDLAPDTLPSRTIGTFSSDDFLNQQVAEKALASLPARARPSASGLLNGLSASAINGTDVLLTYSSTASEAQTQRRLDAYVAAFIKNRRATENAALARAVRTERASNTSTADEAVRRLIAAQKTLPTQIAELGSSSVSPGSKKISGKLAALGGFLAGLAIGVLLVLGFGRLDERVRRARDLDIPGVDTLDVDVRRPASVSRLRWELELAGIGRDLVSATITPACRGRNPGMGIELGRAFAAAGTRVVLLNVGGSRERDGGRRGIRSFLDGTDDALYAEQLAENLVVVPQGSSAIPVESLFSAARMDALIAEAAKLGDVVIVEAPSIEDHATTLLLAAATDLTVLVVQRGRSTYAGVERAMQMLSRVAPRPVRVCFNRGGSLSARSFTGGGAAQALRRPPRREPGEGAVEVTTAR